jgi:hypothetical protein
MNVRARKNVVNRREFLSKTGSGLVVAALPAGAWAAVRDPQPAPSSANVASRPAFPDGAKSTPSRSPLKKKIPIGVLDPVYDHLSLVDVLGE